MPSMPKINPTTTKAWQALQLHFEEIKETHLLNLFANDPNRATDFSIEWNDFFVDTGPHIYHTPDKLLEEFWEKNFGHLLVKGEFWCKNVRGKKYNEYWDYPLSWESISKYPKFF